MRIGRLHASGARRVAHVQSASSLWGYIFGRFRPITGHMTGPILVSYVLLWATLMRALLVKAHVLPPTCARCGLLFERRALGERVCSCHGQNG